MAGVPTTGIAHASPASHCGAVLGIVRCLGRVVCQKKGVPTTGIAASQVSTETAHIDVEGFEGAETQHCLAGDDAPVLPHAAYGIQRNHRYQRSITITGNEELVELQALAGVPTTRIAASQVAAESAHIDFEGFDSAETPRCLAGDDAPLLIARAATAPIPRRHLWEKHPVGDAPVLPHAVYGVQLIRRLKRAITTTDNEEQQPPVASLIHAISVASSEASTEPQEHVLNGLPSMTTHPWSQHEVCFAALSLVFGNAMLTMPYGLVLTGWAGLPIFAAAVALFGYTSLLLGQVLTELEQKGLSNDQYGDIAEHAFGITYRPFFEFFCVLECAFLCIFVHVFVSNTVQPICGLPGRVLVCVTAALGCFLVLVPKELFQFAKFLGLSAAMFCVVAAVGSGVALVDFDASKPLMGTEGFTGLAPAVALVAFTMADHPCFVGLYRNAISPEAYRNGIIEAFAIFYLISAGLCSVCYATYGTQIQKIVLQNIGRDGDGEIDIAWLAASCGPVLCVRGIIVLPDFVEPVVTYVSQKFESLTGIDVSVPKGLQSELDVLELSGRKFCVRMSLVILVFAVCAACAEYLADLLITMETLAACICKAVNAFVVPCCGVWRLCRSGSCSSLSRSEIACLFIALGAGICWSAAGIFSAINQISAHNGLVKT